MQWKPIDLVGIIGAATLLFGVWRTTSGKWKGTGLHYELDNLIGAILMSIYAYGKGAYVSIVLNVIWAIVAFRGVSSYAERKLLHKKSFRLKRRTVQAKRS